jgi:His-Xaa-Ser system radical SAM maturase HxsB
LPFKFERLDERDTVVTNMGGEFLVLPHSDVEELVRGKLSPDSPAYINLRARHFLADSLTRRSAVNLLALKVRSRYRRLPQFTGLHLFVVTLRCEHSCPYCQVSRQSENKSAFDMSEEAALRALNLTFRTPSEAVKIEFQGGEPMLNFPLVRLIVQEAEARNRKDGKALQFVIATNLAVATPEILEFCADHDVHISTSLDGPRELHNANRPRPGGDSYERAIRGIQLAREIVGRDRVSALMTTTRASLSQVKPIIDEYVAQEFHEIFLRPLSPYGFALRTKSFAAYDTQRWLEFYREGIEYIIGLNRKGIPFMEHYAALILKKMLTSDDPGYVDLMSPAGIGIGAVLYNYDGDVYASDESRMLAEMGDKSFKIGNVNSNTYEEIFLNEKLLAPLDESFTLSAPMCSECAFEPFCGADPVYHHAQFGDYLGHKAESQFCQRNMWIFKYLIRRMEADGFVKDLFLRWANH